MRNLVRAVTGDGAAVVTVVDGREIAARIEQIHQTSAVITAALGRLSIAASMIGYGLKNEQDSVTLRVDGGGAAGLLTAVADSHGNVKADVANPVVELPLNRYGKLDVGGAVGRDGTLSVVKDMGLKEPYVGVVPLVSGEIAEDITQYFMTSEQKPTACGLGVLVAPDLSVETAGGFLLEILPYPPEETVTRLEENLKALPPMTTMLKNGMTIDEIAIQILEGTQPDILDRAEVSYRCDCSRERTVRVLMALGRQELHGLGASEKNIDVQCHFCHRVYSFSPAEIRSWLVEQPD